MTKKYISIISAWSLGFLSGFLLAIDLAALIDNH